MSTNTGPAPGATNSAPGSAQATSPTGTGSLASDDELATAIANLSGTYSSIKKATLRRIPKASTVLPAEMVTPPTFALSGPGGATPIASPVHIPYNSTAVRRRGCVPVLVNQFSTDYHQNAVSNWTPPPWWPVTMVYGSDLALNFRAASGVANACKVWVWVDGEPATPAPVLLGTLSAGSLYYYRITFATAAPRRIAVWMDFADFGGFDIGPIDSVGYPTFTEEKIAIYGDSWVEGANSVENVDLWAEQVPWYLGMEGFRAGQAGTGYVANGGGGGKAAYTDATRLSLLAQTTADYVLIFGSINDDGLSGIQAAASAVYAALAASLPSAKLIVVGPPSNGSPSANRLANRAAVQAAAAAAANVLAFIDPIADGWISGTGRAGTLTGSGNADRLYASDGAHLVDADAHTYWRHKVLSAVSTALAA